VRGAAFAAPASSSASLAPLGPSLDPASTMSPTHALSSIATVGAVALALLLPSLLAAQDVRIPAGHADQRVDRFAAVVGDSVVFMTDIEEELLRLRARGVQLPTDPAELAELRRELLEGLINEQLLLQAAARDTLISVPDDRIEAALRQAWDEEIRRWGTETALREELERSQGLSVAQYRAQIRDRLRRDFIIQSFMQLQMREARPVAIDEADIVAYYEAQRAQLAPRPATIIFRQVFVQPEPSPEAMDEARAEIEGILQRLHAGESFEELARQFSNDEASRTRGGDLGWWRRGDGLVREFEDAAFQLREGAVAGPVSTLFGAHLIQVERIRGAERRIRHILIGVEPTEADLERSRSRAEEIRDQIREGASIRTFTEQQRNQDLPDSLEVPRAQLQEIPEAFAQQLLSAGEGDLVGPVPFQLGGGRPAWAIFRVVRIRDEGAFSLDDLRPQIRERLQVERMQERMIRDLRARTYIDIRN
jgi:parvulin-like peptidyl-prolyl isomerase